MKPYSVAEDFLCTVLRAAVPSAMRTAGFTDRYLLSSPTGETKNYPGTFSRLAP